MSIYDDRAALRAERIGAFDAFVASSPSSTTDLLDVTVPAFNDDEQEAFKGLRWQRSGDDLPQQGASCVVQLTDSDAWVIAWWEA